AVTFAQRIRLIECSPVGARLRLPCSARPASRRKVRSNMRRFVLGVLLAAGLSVGASGAASAQVPFGYPNFYGYPGGIPGFGGGYSPVSGPGYGGGPYGTVPDPYGYGFPGSYQYRYGYPFGTPPIYGSEGGVGFTFNSLNYAPFGTTIQTSNT